MLLPITKNYNNMKTLTALFLLPLFYLNASAQNVVYDNSAFPIISNLHDINSDESSAGSGSGKDFHFQVGARFIPTVSSLKIVGQPDFTIKSSTTVNYGFGIFLGYNFNENIGLQLDALYSPIAQKYTANTYDNTVTVNYLSIPLLFSLNSGISDPVNFNFVVGPQLSINTGSSITRSNFGDNAQAVLSTNPIDFGVAYGVGVDFALTPSHCMKLAIGYRGSFGLLDISDKSKSLALNDYYILDQNHINTYGLYAGLTFAF